MPIKTTWTGAAWSALHFSETALLRQTLRTKTCYDEQISSLMGTNDQNFTGEQVRAIVDQHVCKEDLHRGNLERSAFSEIALLLGCAAQQIGMPEMLAGSDLAVNTLSLSQRAVKDAKIIP